MKPKTALLIIELSGTYGVVVDVCTNVKMAMIRSGLHELFHAGEAVRDAAEAAHESLRNDLGGAGRDEPDFHAWSDGRCATAEMKEGRLAASFFNRSVAPPSDHQASRGEWKSCCQRDVPELLLKNVKAAMAQAAESYDALVRREASEI